MAYVMTITQRRRTNPPMDDLNDLSPSIVTVTENTTLTGENFTVLVDATAANVVITLPAAADNESRLYNVKKIDAGANTVTADANASETIDGQATQVLTTQYQSMTLQSNGTAWFIV
jgi:hypothetical protein